MSVGIRCDIVHPLSTDGEHPVCVCVCAARHSGQHLCSRATSEGDRGGAAYGGPSRPSARAEGRLGPGPVRIGEVAAGLLHSSMLRYARVLSVAAGGGGVAAGVHWELPALRVLSVAQ